MTNPLARLDESELLMLVSDILSAPNQEFTPLQLMELEAINTEIEARAQALFQESCMQLLREGSGEGNLRKGGPYERTAMGSVA